ncbi:DoxX family protein [Variovorax paradoxus]|uniref:DoxX family protein n=1 Tax=Variovorax paradoxus TaxID=34073 RepID=UPI003D65BE8E
MLTPVLMILITVLPYLAYRLVWRRGPSQDLRSAAAAGLGLVFLFTASGHFLQTEPMAQMLPSWVPERTALVYLTGVLEIAIAVSLFFRRSRVAGAWAAAAVLIAFFPANVYAAFQQVPMGGHSWGPVYLLVRAPLQLFILWWIWAMVLEVPGKTRRAAV